MLLANLWVSTWIIPAFAHQLPLLTATTSQHENDNITAPFVFNSLTSLLRQWPNTYHPNGHTVIPGVLKPYTTLYHARKDDSIPPPSPEWLAFDYEMSYALVVPTDGPTYLSTYVNTHPANIIYFDGMSGAVGTTRIGWLDSQEVLVSQKGKNGSDETIIWWDDYVRAGRLCDWAKKRDVDGFVRMNAGFELLWCDFSSSSMQLVSHVNITPPGTPEPAVPIAFYDGRQDTFPPNVPPPPWENPVAPLAESSADEWVRSATRRAKNTQSQITLDYSGFVTLYHPRLRSLFSSRAGHGMRYHRAWPTISDADAISFTLEVDEVLRRRQSGVTGTAIDWGTISNRIVEQWADRLMQIRFLLRHSIFDADADAREIREIVHRVWLLTYASLSPFLEMGSLLNLSSWDLVFAKPTFVDDNSVLANTSSSAFDRCVSSGNPLFTFSTTKPRATLQEIFLQESIETITGRICSDIGLTFAESADLHRATDLDIPSSKLVLDRWRARLDLLVEWLDWPVWLRCKEICNWDSVCAMPMWPVNVKGGPWQNNPVDEWQPTCRKYGHRKSLESMNLDF